MRTSEQTLAKYAVQGRGPEFQRYSRDVVYDVQKLDEWARSRLSKPFCSTSQADASDARTENEGRSPRNKGATALEGERQYTDSNRNSTNQMSRDYLRRLTKEELIEQLLARPCGAGPP
jgi:hypothetical protein